MASNEVKNEEESHVSLKLVDSSGRLKGPSTWVKVGRLLFGDDPLESLRLWRKQIVGPAIRKILWEGAGALIYGQPVNVGNGGPIIGGNGNIRYDLASSASSGIPAMALTSKPVTGGKKFNGTVYFAEPTPEEKQKDPTVLSAYQQARQTYEELVRILKDYKWVRLAELYEIANIPGIEYVSNAWGWSDLSGSSIYPSNNGYILQLPDACERK